jgi:hypothetical protein
MNDLIPWPSDRRLVGALPPGWFGKESLTLLAPDGQANVIASSEPLDPGLSTQQYAEIQGDLLRKEFSRYTEYSYDPVELLGGRQGYRRVFEWTPPDGVTVVQAQLYHADGGRGYTATATTPSTEYERFRDRLGDVLAALQLVALDERDGPASGDATSDALPTEDLLAAFELAGLSSVTMDEHEDGVTGEVSVDTETTGCTRLQVFLAPHNLSELGMTIRVLGDDDEPLERWWELVETANAWNLARAAPTAAVLRRQDDPSRARFVLVHHVPVPANTRAWVAATVRSTTENAVGFHRWLRHQRGL